MSTWVALLRGVNVGGSTRVAMADLRELVTSLGHTDVQTYVNSGNVVFRAAGRVQAATLEGALEAAIAEQLGVRPAVLVRSGRDLAEVVQANPFGEESDPKKVHVVFLRDGLDAAGEAAARAAEEEAAGRGSRDRVRPGPRSVYLHTPDGLGRSVLADLLSRRVSGHGTARNWSTVTRLLAMCEQAGAASGD